MVARDTAGLLTQIISLFPDNTSGQISATDLRSWLIDITDSAGVDPATFVAKLASLTADDRLGISSIKNTDQDVVNAELISNGMRFTRRDSSTFDVVAGATYQAPSITGFRLSNIAESVPAGTVIDGAQQISYTINNVANVENGGLGELTFSQFPGPTYATDVSAGSSGSTENITPSITVNAGESITFRLEGTNTLGDTFGALYTVRAPEPHEFLYHSLSAFNNPDTIDVSTTTDVEIEGTGTSLDIATGTTTVGQFYIILVPSNEDATSITDILGNDVRSLFARTADVRQINGIDYTSYVAGPLTAGDSETYRVTF